MQRLLCPPLPFPAAPLLHVPLFAPGVEVPKLQLSFELAFETEDVERSFRGPNRDPARTMTEN